MNQVAKYFIIFLFLIVSLPFSDMDYNSDFFSDEKFKEFVSSELLQEKPTPVQTILLEGFYKDNQTYSDMTKWSGYALGHLKNEGAKLIKKIGAKTGLEMNKKTLMTTITKCYRKKYSDDQTLVSSSTDDTVRPWDLKTGPTRNLLQPQKPYEEMNITDVKGLTAAQKVSSENGNAATVDSELDILYEQLEHFLQLKEWKAAEEKTRELLLYLTSSKSKGYLDKESILQIPCEDLLKIDRLWAVYSDNNYGFSAQAEISRETGNRLNIEKEEDWTQTDIENFFDLLIQ